MEFKITKKRLNVFFLILLVAVLGIFVAAQSAIPNPGHKANSIQGLDGSSDDASFVRLKGINQLVLETGAGANIELYGSGELPANKAFYDAVEHTFRDIDGTSGGDVRLTGNIRLTGIGPCEGKLYTDSNGYIKCGVDASGSSYWQPSGGNDIFYNNGNVGIGVAAPTEKLQVSGAILAAGGDPGANNANDKGYAFETDHDSGIFQSGGSDGNLGLYTQAAERVRILPNGNVGIGAGDPFSKFVVAGGNDQLGIVWTADNRAVIQTRLDDPANLPTYGGDQENRLILQPDVGRVGIGTVNPQAKLDVSGNIQATGDVCGGLKCLSTAGTVTGIGNVNRIAKWTGGNSIGNSMQIYDDGTNVGIGTTIPQAKLHVNGIAMADVFSEDQASSGYFIDMDGTSSNIKGLKIENNLIVGGLTNLNGGAKLPTNTCVVRTDISGGGSLSFAANPCLSGEVITGGGGICIFGEMIYNAPSAAVMGTETQTWNVGCSTPTIIEIRTICCKFK